MKRLVTVLGLLTAAMLAVNVPVAAQTFPDPRPRPAADVGGGNGQVSDLPSGSRTVRPWSDRV